MNPLEQYRVFVQVAEMGSFIKAAHALDLPRATVSAAIQQLESRLAVRLLNRTTRQVSLTDDGSQLMERLRPLLAEAENIEQMFLGPCQQEEVAGRLHINAPSRIARRLIAPALPGLLRRHPQLQLVLGSSDRTTDLVRDGVDCAVRIGPLQDSSLVARPLGQLELINCASPAYLRNHGEPHSPAELREGHCCVGYASPRTGRAMPWEYRNADGHDQALSLPSRVLTNSAENYIACCIAGLGLIQIPRFDVQHLLGRGALVEVMPAHRAAPMPVSLVYPHRRQRSRRLAVFESWLQDLLRQNAALIADGTMQ
ncbi:LysR family transcriptional regulator [Corticibacter populi]|uniref:LysR family transcriptional regulator n=1 Tax=Corticibacter populi TaxID=1550736 RepID=A0A3M6R0M9_9BURK|nr:LysR family transcriptional regulator [Corticibacter populi]RMX08814.1 LysR family transcriptional regulator [Corticibacter populi]RZS30208.1 DNA-binding transcriptional LysR family regulator [Corticibacter populi]